MRRKTISFILSFAMLVSMITAFPLGVTVMAADWPLEIVDIVVTPRNGELADLKAGDEFSLTAVVKNVSGARFDGLRSFEYAYSDNPNSPWLNFGGGRWNTAYTSAYELHLEPGETANVTQQGGNVGRWFTAFVGNNACLIQFTEEQGVTTAERTETAFSKLVSAAPSSGGGTDPVIRKYDPPKAPAGYVPLTDWPNASNTGCDASVANLPESEWTKGFPRSNKVTFGGNTYDCLPYNRITIDQDGTVLENLYIAGGLNIVANDVVVKNCYIVACEGVNAGDYVGGTAVVGINAGSSATLINCTLDGMEGVHCGVSYSGDELVLLACNIFDVNDGVMAWKNSGTQSDNFLIQDNFIHKLTHGTANGHIDGFQSEGSVNGLIKHNYFEVTTAANASIAVWNAFGDAQYIMIDNNYVMGGSNTIYCDDYASDHGADFFMKNVWIVNNVFSNVVPSYWSTWSRLMRGEDLGRYGPNDGWNVVFDYDPDNFDPESPSFRWNNTVDVTGENIDFKNIGQPLYQLRFIDVVTTPANPAPGETFTVSILIRNQSREPVHAVKDIEYNYGTPNNMWGGSYAWANDVVFDLAGGEEILVPLTNGGDRGNGVYTAIAGSRQTVVQFTEPKTVTAERNATRVSRWLTVTGGGSAVPNILRLTGFRTTPSILNDGDTFTIEAAVTNTSATQDFEGTRNIEFAYGRGPDPWSEWWNNHGWQDGAWLDVKAGQTVYVPITGGGGTDAPAGSYKARAGDNYCIFQFTEDYGVTQAERESTAFRGPIHVEGDVEEFTIKIVEILTDPAVIYEGDSFNFVAVVENTGTKPFSRTGMVFECVYGRGTDPWYDFGNNKAWLNNYAFENLQPGARVEVPITDGGHLGNGLFRAKEGSNACLIQFDQSSGITVDERLSSAYARQIAPAVAPAYPLIIDEILIYPEEPEVGDAFGVTAAVRNQSREWFSGERSFEFFYGTGDDAFAGDVRAWAEDYMFDGLSPGETAYISIDNGGDLGYGLFTARDGVNVSLLRFTGVSDEERAATQCSSFLIFGELPENPYRWPLYIVDVVTEPASLVEDDVFSISAVVMNRSYLPFSGYRSIEFVYGDASSPWGAGVAYGGGALQISNMMPGATINIPITNGGSTGRNDGTFYAKPGDNLYCMQFTNANGGDGAERWETYITNGVLHADAFEREPGPYLTVTGMTWNPSSPKVNDHMSFSVTVRNSGDETAYNVVPRYYLDGSYSGGYADPAQNIAAGQSRTFNINRGGGSTNNDGRWYATPGAHTVTATVQYGGGAESEPLWSGNFYVEPGSSYVYAYDPPALPAGYVPATAWPYYNSDSDRNVGLLPGYTKDNLPNLVTGAAQSATITFNNGIPDYTDPNNEPKGGGPWTTSRTPFGPYYPRSGEVIENAVILGGIIVNPGVKDVVIRNCYIEYCYAYQCGGYGGGTAVVKINTGGSATIQNCVINGGEGTHCGISHEGIELVAVGNDIFNTNDGVFCWKNSGQDGDNLRMQDNYIHDLTNRVANGHVDGYQTESLVNGLIKNNTFDLDLNATSNLALWNAFGDTMYVMVQGNLFMGGGVTIYACNYAWQHGADYTWTNCWFVDNAFSTKYSPKIGLYAVWSPTGDSDPCAPADGWSNPAPENFDPDDFDWANTPTFRLGNYVIETGESLDFGEPGNMDLLPPGEGPWPASGSYAASRHALAGVNSGVITTEFNLTVDSPGAVVGYTQASVTANSDNELAASLKLDGAFTPGSTYRVRFVINTYARVYDIYATELDGEDGAPLSGPVQLACGLKFKSVMANVGAFYTAGSGYTVNRHMIVPTWWTASFDNNGSAHKLGDKNTGDDDGFLVSKFDIVADLTSYQFLIAYMDGAHDLKNPSGYSSFGRMSIGVMVNPGGLIMVKNGSAAWVDSGSRMVAGQTYHFTLIVDLNAKTYSTWYAPEGGSPVKLTEDYAYRPDLGVITNLGTAILMSDDGTYNPANDGNMVAVSNHTVLDYANFAAALDRANAAETAEDMAAALLNSALGLSVVKYSSLVAADRLEVAGTVLSDKGSAVYTDLEFQKALDLAVVGYEPGEDPFEFTVYYELTVVSGEGGSVVGDGGSYEAGEIVTLTAEADFGYEFAGWTADGIELEDEFAEEITFAMPENDVTVTANFEPEKLPLIYDALTDAIESAMDRLSGITVLADGTAPGDVVKGAEYWLEADVAILEAAIAAAGEAFDGAATQDEIDFAVDALGFAELAFVNAMKVGTKVDMPPVTLVNITTDPSCFVSMTETAKNSRVWVLTFNVRENYSDGSVKAVRYSINLNGNNANLDGEYKFASGHGLAGYTLVYDVKGNGSNIKAFRLVMK